MSRLIGAGDFDRRVGIRLVSIGVGVGIGVGIVLRSAAGSGGTVAPGGQWIEVTITLRSIAIAFCFRHRNELTAKGLLVLDSGQISNNCNAIVRLISELLLGMKVSIDGGEGDETWIPF